MEERLEFVLSDMLYKKLTVLVSVLFLETPVKNLLNSNFFSELLLW